MLFSAGQSWSDVNLVAQAEHWFGHGRGLSSFLVVSIEHSIGLGVIHRDELFRGAKGLSPDLGDMVVSSDQPCTSGSELRRLSAIASMPAIVAAARDAVQGTADEARLRGSHAVVHAARLAAAGNLDLQKIFHDAGQALGVAIANLITLFAPPKVILAGSALQVGDLLLHPLQDSIRAATPKILSDLAEIVVHDPGDDMWARGAAALTLRDLYGAPWNTTGPAR